MEVGAPAGAAVLVSTAVVSDSLSTSGVVDGSNGSGAGVSAGVGNFSGTGVGVGSCSTFFGLFALVFAAVVTCGVVFPAAAAAAAAAALFFFDCVDVADAAQVVDLGDARFRFPFAFEGGDGAAASFAIFTVFAMLRAYGVGLRVR